MRKTFVGIGAGPIQTGIYVAGAARGGFDRIVLADVDKELIQAVRRAGSITVNTAGKSGITTQVYSNIEIYDPSVPEDLKQLKAAAAEAIALNTALPSIRFYPHCKYLAEAFAASPDIHHYMYTSENCTVAAEELEKVLGSFPNVSYLDTVIGKMSKIFPAAESDLPPLAPGYSKGHLVEEFNTIYSTHAPGLEQVNLVGLYPKKDIYPFEEAKLFGHNASHFLLGLLAAEKGCAFMSEATNFPEITNFCRQALKEECAPALCKKFAGVDEYFELENFRNWADELVDRMTSVSLSDSVERVLRDLDRKLSWNDRVVGAIRMCLEQGIYPERLIHGMFLALKSYGLQTMAKTWPEEERNAFLQAIAGKRS